MKMHTKRLGYSDAMGISKDQRRGDPGTPFDRKFNHGSQLEIRPHLKSPDFFFKKNCQPSLSPKYQNP